MKEFYVKSSQDQYVVQLNEDYFSFHKNPETTQLFNLFYPVIEETKNRYDNIQPKLPKQYQHSIRQISLIQKVLKNHSFDEMKDQQVALEEILHLATEWNYFLQDVFKVFDTELPQ